MLKVGDKVYHNESNYEWEVTNIYPLGDLGTDVTITDEVDNSIVTSCDNVIKVEDYKNSTDKPWRGYENKTSK